MLGCYACISWLPEGILCIGRFVGLKAWNVLLVLTFGLLVYLAREVSGVWW